MSKGTAKTGASSKPVAWWLLGGEEACPHCGQLYIYELEFRCPDCDSPSCPHCRQQHAEGRVVCISCVASSSEE